MGKTDQCVKGLSKIQLDRKKYMCSTSEEKLIYTNLLSKKVKESQQEIDVIFIIKYAFLRLVRNKSRYSSKKYKFLANKSWAYGPHLQCQHPGSRNKRSLSSRTAFVLQRKLFKPGLGVKIVLALRKVG